MKAKNSTFVVFIYEHLKGKVIAMIYSYKKFQQKAILSILCQGGNMRNTCILLITFGCMVGLIFFPAVAFCADDTIGEQRTAVILIDYENNGEEQPASLYHEAFFTGARSFNNFVHEASYEKAWLTGDVYGWYHISPVPSSVTTPPYFPSYEECFAIADDDVYYPNYDRIVFILRCFNTQYPGAFGRSSFGKIQVTTDDGIVTLSKCQIRVPTIYPQGDVSNTYGMTIAHELMHSFGVTGHAHSYECGPSAIDYNPANSIQLSNADRFDIMGGRFFASIPNGAFKDKLHWLDPENKVECSQSGVYTIYPLNEISPLPKVLVIPLSTPIPVGVNGVTISKYYLEYRIPTGFDIGLNKLINADWMNFMFGIDPVDITGIIQHGVFLVDGEIDHTYLIDSKPGSIQTGLDIDDFMDCFININQTFYDSGNQISIQPQQLRFDGGIDVLITFNASNQPPVLDPIGNHTVNEGENLQFTVNATDPDQNALFYTVGSLPVGAVFDSATRVFNWTPDYNQAGVYLGIHFEVSDGSLADYENITITVNNVNFLPRASAGPDQDVEVDLPVTFDGSGSSDSDGSISSYNWDFGDGTFGTGQTVTHVYSSTGNYTATLTVTDNDGGTGSDTCAIAVQRTMHVDQITMATSSGAG